MQDLYGGLTTYSQFVLYRKEWDAKKSKWSKRPANTFGAIHDAHDRSIWVSYDVAVNAAQLLGEPYGVGFVFCVDDPFFFLDMDDCLINGQWSPVAVELCGMFPGAYTEVSMGGQGLHVVGTITEDIEHACRNGANNLEFYTEGRFMALGRPESAYGSVATVHNDQVRSMVTKYFDPTNVVSGTTAAQSDEWTTSHSPQSRPILNDEVLIQKAIKSVSGAAVFGGNSSATFTDLWTASDNLGQYFPPDKDGDAFNRSMADSSLATHLMFWTGGDCDRTKRLMRMSALNREKFDREDYMSWTILGAKRTHANGGGQFYSMTDEVIQLNEPCEQAVALGEELTSRLVGYIKGITKGTSEQDRVIQFNVDVQSIDNIITRSFWSGNKSKLFILTDENTLVMFSEKDMLRIAEKCFGSIVDNAEIEHYAEIAAATMAGGDMKSISDKLTSLTCRIMTDYLKLFNQRDRLRSKVDMFATRPRMEWSSDSVTNIFVWNKIPYLGTPDKNIIDDYLIHFPMFEPLLEQIVAARFASDRKNAFTWLRADSDWGKGIFTSVLKDLALLVELSVTEVEKAFEGAPMAKDAPLFTHAFTVCFNEFKKVKSELKQIESELPISPKNQLGQTVDIYHKLFMSAESVDSLVGEAGVEDQFANRFSYIDGKGSIVERHMFLAVGKFRYFTAVKQHVAIRVSEMVKSYVSLGEDQARVEADKFLDHFHNKYGISQTFERISSNLPSIIQSFKEWVIATHTAPIAGTETHLYKDEHFYYLTSSSKVFTDWTDSTASRSERITLNKKKNEILNILSNGLGVKQYMLNNTNKKALRFNL